MPKYLKQVGELMNEALVGLQLYTVRDQTAQNFAETVRSVAQIGYASVEFAGYGNLTPREMAVLLKDTGLKAAGSHVALSRLQENLDYEINYALEIGCSNVIIPWLEPKWRSAEGFRELAPFLNEVGRRCKEQGITFAYHNHDFEFAQVNGEYILDILLNTIEPDLLKLELDTYWVAYAGVDPIDYLHKHVGRIKLVHLKDMTPEHTFTEVGDGTLNIKGIVEAAQATGVQWYIVENDAPTIPSLESAQRSWENLRTI
jgi:sugar phosphate isomerase/epimerase